MSKVEAAIELDVSVAAVAAAFALVVGIVIVVRSLMMTARLHRMARKAADKIERWRQ